GVARLRLRHDERVVFLRDLAQSLGLFPRNVDRALARERRVVEVEYLVVERLQRALREGDEPDGNIEAREPRCRFDQVREVLEVDLDVAALADAAHGGDETHRGIRL